VHFPGQLMSESENEILIHDYLDDLHGFPFDLIQQVCNEYRYEGGNENFPKAGLLRQSINIHFYKRLSKLNKLRALIEVSERDANNSLANQ
jgi:hypothetical protein